jgi:23S rRNA pseudouridine1911/1915/1917 synthase
MREQFIVTKSDAGKRLQEVAQLRLTTISSKTGVKKAIKRGLVEVDGEVAQTAKVVQEGVVVILLKDEPKTGRQFLIKLDRIFEDEFCAVIFKPAGIPVSGNYFKTIQNGIFGNLKTSSKSDSLTLPRPVHRLDSPTSGLLLIAKTETSLVNLSRAFEQKRVEKKYVALVIGETGQTGEMRENVDRKTAHSSYVRLRVVNSRKYGKISLLELTPHTGRTHQLRIHCANAGFEIIGDSIYGEAKNLLKGKGLFLSAVKLKFPHPKTGEEICVSSEIPVKFEKLLNREQERYERLGTT